MKIIINIFLLFFIIHFSNVLNGADYYAFQNGNYTSTAIWRIGSCTGPLAGSIPGITDNVFICAGVTVNVNLNVTANDVHVYGAINLQGSRTFTVSGNMYMYANSTLSGDNNNGSFSLSNNFYLYDGATINGTQNFNIIVNGNVYNEPTISGNKAIVGKCDLIVWGVTYINGYFMFTLSAQGNKRFNGGIVISNTGTFDNTVGEDPRINGDIVNNGNWIGCTGGNCEYTLGNIAGRIINITGSNPISLSTIIIGDASSTVNNYSTIILDRAGGNGTLIRNLGTFNNYGVLYIGRGQENTPIENTVVFNASYTGNTVHFYKSNGVDQQVRIPNDGSYYNLVIAGNATKYLQTAGGTLKVTNNLTIKDDATLWIKSTEALNGTASLTMTNNGLLKIDKCTPAQPELTGTYLLQNNSRIILNGSCNQTYNAIPAGSNSVVNITLSGSGIKTLTGITTINGNLEITGSATLGAHSFFTMSCNSSFIYSSTGTTNLSNNIKIGSFEQTNGTINAGSFTIFVCGDYWRTNGGTFNPGTGTVVFQGNTSVEGSVTPQFYNIAITPVAELKSHMTQMNIRRNINNNGVFTHRQGRVVFNGTSIIQGVNNTTFYDLQINAGSSLTGHSSAFYVERNWTNNGGTYDPNGGTVYFTGPYDATLTKAGTETFYNIVVNKPSNNTITSNITTLNVINNLTINSGTLIIGTNTLNGAGGLTMTGGELRIAKIGPPVPTLPELTGTYTLTGGTVHLSGAGNQTLQSGAPGSTTYYNLILSGSGNKNISGVTTFNGDITVLGSAVISNHSAFTQAADKSFTYSSTGTTSLQNNITIGSYIQTDGTLNPNNRNLTVTGYLWQKSGGTFQTGGRVIFAGSTAQYFYDNSTIFLNFTMNNPDHLYLMNNNLQISTNLTLNSGQIVTGNDYKVSLLQTTSTITYTSGWVNGWFELNLPASSPAKTFYIGTDNYYSPLNLTFSGNNAGTLRIRAKEGDHPDIYSTDIDPNKTVNIYWQINNSVGGTTNITFNYPSNAVDAIADPANFKIVQYILPDATYITPSTTPTYTQTQITGLTSITGDFIIGEKYNPEFVYNANTGNIYWSNPDNWIQIRTGTITASTSSNVVTGTSTLFSTEINVGDKIALQSNPTTYLGIVASVINDNTLLLTANATQNATNASFGRKKLPEVNDIVNIGFMPLSSTNVNVILDIDANIHMLQFTPMARSNTLTFQDGKTLNITTNVNLNIPSTATNTNLINVGNGVLNVNGNIVIGRGGVTNRIGRMILNKGQINIGTNLVFSATEASAAVLDMIGTGRVNLGNTFVVNNASTNNKGTFNQGPDAIFCYCGSSVAQTVYYNTTNTPNIKYTNLYFGNTSGSGVTIPSNITATNVTGDVVVESGLFYYGGTFGATGNAGKYFRVKNDATFRMTGTATFPTGFIYDFEPNSNVEYRQTTNNLIITSATYGNLYCIPATNVTQRFPVTDIIIKGNLTIGGINGSTLDIATNDPNVYCDGNVTVNSNTTLTFSDAARNFNVGGDWICYSSVVPTNLTTSTIIFNGNNDQQIAGTITTQYFPLIQINKPVGTKVYTSGSTTTLNTASISVTQGEFILPQNINITNQTTSNVTIQANGILNGTNSNITLNGSWTNNGGTFIYDNSIINFTGGNVQNINGTATSQYFNDIIINKTNGNVTIGGSTNYLELNNYTQYNRTFSSSNGNTIIKVNGNFTLENNSSFNGTNITNLYLRKNITYNSTGTWTMSQNVYLDGTTQQNISGSSNIPQFTNLTIDNTLINDAIILNKPITVTGTLTLTRGQVVTTSTNLLTMETASSINLNAPGGNQKLSFIKGPLRHRINSAGTTTRIFPVGKDTIYHRIDLQVTYGTAQSTYFTGEFKLESAKTLGWSLPPSLVRVSDIDYWEITRSGGTNPSQAYVTLYFNTNFDSITDFSSLRVAKGDPSSWIDLGGNVIIPATEGAIKSTVPFTSFSKFALASTQLLENPLPIELAEFKAFPEGKIVKTEWITYSEYNNDYFVVEKSTDLKTFIEVGRVKGAGFSSVINKYELLDYYPVKGVSYYRLKQVDFDGKYSYSDTVAVIFTEDNNSILTPVLEIYPNPLVSNPLYVKLTSFPPANEVLIVVVNQLGEVLYSKVVITDVNGDLLEATDPYDLLPQGIYYVIAASKNYTLNKKLVIKK